MRRTKRWSAGEAGTGRRVLSLPAAKCHADEVLVVMAGLPSSGKSTLATALAAALPAPVLSVDPVEAAMWRAGVDRGQPTGLAAYVVVEALAREQLAVGHSVVVDAVNDVAEARQQWVDLARRSAVPLRFVEVTCSDPVLHRQRLENRRRGLEGFVEPTWESVQSRRESWASWRHERLVLDSAQPLQDNVHRAVRFVRS